MTAIIPKVTELSSRVIRILGCNPGLMTLQGTNTYLIGNGKSRLLLDCGEPNVCQYISNLKDVIEGKGIQLNQIVVSHWHNDHIGGLTDVLKALKLSNRDCKIYKICDEERDRQDMPSIPFQYLTDGQELSTDGATLRVVATPGHTRDHLVLVLEEENALFSGDCILGEGTAVFEDLYTYMASLRKILALKPSVIYPGHGGVIEEPISKIEEYIKHRQQREEQIVKAMTDLNRALTPMEIVETVYKDVSPLLFSAAAVNVWHHLEKLVKENRVSKCEERDNQSIVKFKIVL